jgi:mannose-6-phosphate isomerase
MESAVAQLKKGGCESGYAVQAEQRYAELWMGTHPSGPSRILPTHPGESPVLLRDYLQVRANACAHRSDS